MAKRKSQREATPKAPLQPAPRPLEESPRSAGVTLWGEVVQEFDGRIEIAIANVGDAKVLGLCGKHWFKNLQIFKRGRNDGYDWIRVSYELAALKAKSCQPCE